jgi:hypothetical protein
MDNDFHEKKTQKKYACISCLYNTSNRYDFNRHLSTTKHKMDNKNAFSDEKNARASCCKDKKQPTSKYTCLCGKSYKFQSGLCKHRHMCILHNPVDNSEFKNELILDVGKISKNDFSMNMMNNVIRDQNELLNRILELSKENKTTNYYTDCNNKKMTLNVFLNEKCKNAMNFTDFIDNLQISTEDLSYTKEHGYVKGVSNIFLKHLKGLDPESRPIHCSDKKRLQFYVKDEDMWKKDTNNFKIDKSIDDISKKQMKQIIEWQKQHPDYESDEILLNEFFTITRHIIGRGNANTLSQNGNEIKKNIGNEVELKDAMLLENKK